jgi:phosphoglycolate phosphatase
MLILFDIDATLIKTQGVGLQAMVEAGQRLFGPQFNAEGIDVSGRLDPLIIGEMLRKADQAWEGDAGRRNAKQLREAYASLLPAYLKPGIGRALPGVFRLLEELERVHIHQAPGQSATLGLLTGNFAETGVVKLRSCGIEPERFVIQVWGDESPEEPPSRNQLPGVALARFLALHGEEAPRDQSTVIGDTPHDIACAKAHGLRSLGVGTGQYSVDALLASGADRAVADLSQWEEISRWLMGPSNRGRATSASASRAQRH